MNRKSMGKVHTSLKPQRLSTAAPAAPGGSAARRSRLPQPRTSSTSSKRPSSMEPPHLRVSSAALGVMGSAFKTPRSSSATPSSRQPLSKLSINMPQSTGKRSSIHGGQVSHAKDSRPLNDREWQRTVIRDLVSFCTEQFPNLSIKDFEHITTSNFRSIFEYLYGFLNPGYKLPEQREKPLQKVIPELMKQLDYPSNLSSSHFQTLGGPSWGTVVGVLHFLLTLSKLTDYCYTNSKVINFPNNDGFSMGDDDKKSISEIEHDFFLTCYQEYNAGRDEFSDEFNNLFWELMDSHGIKVETMEQLELTLEKLEKENEVLKLDSGEVQKLTKLHGEVLADIKSLDDFYEQQRQGLKAKKSELTATHEAIEALKHKLAQLQAQMEKLEDICRSKGINPRDSTLRFEEMIMSIKRRLEDRKAELSEAENIKWKIENNTASLIANLDKKKSQFGHKLIDLSDQEVSRELRDMAFLNSEANDQMVANKLHQLFVAKKEELSSGEKSLKDLRQNLKLTKREIEVKVSEEQLAVEEEAKLRKQKAQVLEEIKSEESRFVAKIKAIKDEMDSLLKRQTKMGREQGNRQVQLEEALKDKVVAEIELEDFRKEAQAYLADYEKECLAEKEFHEKKRALAIEKYQECLRLKDEAFKAGLVKAEEVKKTLEKREEEVNESAT